MVSAKRKRHEEDAEDASPRKLRAQITQDDSVSELGAQTPSRRGRGLAENGTPRSILKKSGLADNINVSTPRSNRRLLFATPTKAASDETSNGTPTIVRNADRSARRKSNRSLIDRTITGTGSEDEALDEEEALAQQILSDEENVANGELEDTDAGAEEAVPVPETPSKRGRGRPKGSGKNQKARAQRSPTPPNQLPAHEEYFWQNRPGGAKTSSNTLPSHSLLNHDEYFEAVQSHVDSHKGEKLVLLELHSRAYDQWMFELGEGFNICLYGYGSKRPITDEFMARMYRHLLGQAPYKGTKKLPKLVVINGYAPGITLKDILVTVASAAILNTAKLPNQPSALLAYILDHLSKNAPPHPILVVINSIDSPYLRKSPTPAILAMLAADPSINLVCTADTPNFPLMWDVGLKAQYRFLFHDATTFAPYEAEIDVVETVNELLGRSGRRVGGRDGVGFVLRSLPENARLLFQILVNEQLALLLMDGEEVDNDNATATSKSKRNVQLKDSVSEATQGVEYRVLYHKASAAFVATSEVAFRTLLKEFHDHQMIESRKDAMGTERLWVPFRQEELELLAEELSNGDAF
ncbi:Origin recognition complex subunit 2 [Kalmusia sp. IMI 367209]|nr:Origin recognition complex subunit 2 [Kalmusia sp. IMI 367209]